MIAKKWKEFKTNAEHDNHHPVAELIHNVEQNSHCNGRDCPTTLHWRYLSIVASQITSNSTKFEQFTLIKKKLKAMHYMSLGNSSNKGPAMQKALSCYDVMMNVRICTFCNSIPEW